MREAQHLYINGEWTAPEGGTVQELTAPATGRPSGRIVLGGGADADRAVRAAREVFPRATAAGGPTSASVSTWRPSPSSA